MKKIFFSIIIIMLFAGTSSSTTFGNIGLDPLRLNIGSRPNGMGGAFLGVSDDENACFYNPGGLPWAKGLMIYIRDSKNLSLVQAYPTGYESTFGLAYTLSGISSYTTSIGQNLDYENTIIHLSAASKLSAFPFLNLIPTTGNFGVGMNLKVLLSQKFRLGTAANQIGQGWDLDLGVLYKALPWLTIGGTAQNIMPTGSNIPNGGVIVWNNDEKEGIPAILGAGVSAKLIGDLRSPIYSEGNEVYFNLDSQALRSNAIAWTSYGIEWVRDGIYVIRLGAYTDPSSQDTSSAGFGAKYEGWGFDISTNKEPVRKERVFTFSIAYQPEEWIFEKKPEKKVYRDISIPELVSLDTPKDETTTYEDSIVVSGSVKEDVLIEVNNMEAAKDLSGSFQTRVPLNPGKNLVLIDFIYDDGKMKVERKVFRKPKIIISEEIGLEPTVKKNIEALVTLGVIDVARGAQFSLKAAVTRAELASWLVKAANLPIKRVTAQTFSDVPASHPLAPFINAAVNANLMSGKGDKFYPDKFVSLSEAKEIFKKFGVIR